LLDIPPLDAQQDVISSVFTPAVSGDADDPKCLFRIPNIYGSHGSGRAFGPIIC
jgi:hypothetical protein